MDIVIRSPGRDMEDLLSECRNLTWNQVFVELDRLSRAGRIILKQQGRGHYTVTPGPESGTRIEIIH